ncbi:MAG: LLM class flavin-dependent oxidoreductase [Dehalococcoidia bacterium]
MSLRIGMQIGPQDCTYEDLKELWHMADSSGFYWVSLWDHMYHTRVGTGSCFEAVATMAALAAETTNVRVGCLVFRIGLRNPALLAKAAVTIDHISNGRLELGLGPGWYGTEFKAYGYPFPSLETRFDMLEEGVQIIRSMLTQEETTFHGQHYTVEKAYCFPRPIQKALRIWIGGTEERFLRIAAKYGDGWDGAYVVSPEIYRATTHLLDQLCEEEGRDPSEVQRSVGVPFYMGADGASAKRKREEADRVFPERTPESILTGEFSEVIEQIGGYVEAGASHLNITIQAPFDFDALQAFIEEVMPAFSE